MPNKQYWVDLGYQESISDKELNTLYKKFEDGGMYIVQFNESVSEEEIGLVYLSKNQLQHLFLFSKQLKDISQIVRGDQVTLVDNSIGTVVSIEEEALQIKLRDGSIISRNPSQITEVFV